MLTFLADSFSLETALKIFLSNYDQHIYFLKECGHQTEFKVARNVMVKGSGV